MIRKLWLVLVGVAASAVVSQGCTAECEDRFDCRSEGAGFICVDGECVEGEPEPEEDAGVTPDAGIEDAGTEEDAGVDMDAGVDAGMQMDAGTFGSCTTMDPTCTGPFRCDLTGALDGGTGSCVPLWIGVTQDLDAGVTPLQRAVLVPFNQPGTTRPLGAASAQSRSPRFSGDGQAVVFVQAPTVGGLGPVELLRHDLSANTDSVLTNSIDAGTVDFVQVEFDPTSRVLWTKVDAMGTRSGIQWIPGNGGAVQSATPQGGYGDWFPDGMSLVYDFGGLQVRDVAGGTDTALTSDTNDTQPKVSADGAWVLYLRENPSVSASFAQDLYVISAMGGTSQLVEAHMVPVGTAADGGTVGRYVTHPSWGAGAQVAYVRVNYYLDAAGVPTLCEPTDPVCAGTAGQQILIQRLDGTTGAPMGMPVIHGPGVQPSLSPDGTYLAYVIRNVAGGSDLRVVPVDTAGNATDAGFSHSFPRLNTEEDLGTPRWQPK